MEVELLQRSTGSCDLMQFMVSLQQQRRKLFLWKVEGRGRCAELVSADPGCIFV